MCEAGSWGGGGAARRCCRLANRRANNNIKSLDTFPLGDGLGVAALLLEEELPADCSSLRIIA